MTRRSVFDSLGQDLLHQFLREEMRSGQLDRFPFLPCPHVEKINFLAARDSIRQLARLDLHRQIGFMTGDDVFRHLIDVEIFVASADASERFVRAESATAATADVILAERARVAPRETARAVRAW